ncbi:MAG: segregation/condensation protein A [Verrucomicrobia bacterium]|nr:segregation/condensation protein A [Verrucomicrobiota bacterium]MCF7708137.1 segregation/condensation protein A [Verrucomicrobiota bacterium]
MADYKVQLDVFEGPMDLLLYLIKKEEVDIYEVNLTRIASEFIEYVEAMRQLDLEIAGDFLVMAATLMYFKSKELLPLEQQAIPEGEEDELDPRWELIRQLVEYKKFKDAATHLQSRELEQQHIYRRIPPTKLSKSESTGPDRLSVSMLDLINAVNSILKRIQKQETPGEIYSDPWTVSEKIEEISRRIQETPKLPFAEVFIHAGTRLEVIATFLAMLELIRIKRIMAVQNEPFGEIEIIGIDETADEQNDRNPSTPPGIEYEDQP